MLQLFKMLQIFLLIVGQKALQTGAFEQTKHWRGKPLFTNNRLPHQCFVSSEPSDAPVYRGLKCGVAAGIPHQTICQCAQVSWHLFTLKVYLAFSVLGDITAKLVL